MNQNTPNLTVENPTKSMSGTEYRCIVSQTNMKTEKSSVVYSNTVKLTVDKASSTTELGTSRTGGNATHETTVETKKTVTAEYKQGNATYQKYKNAYTEDDKITGDVFGGSEKRKEPVFLKHSADAFFRKTKKFSFICWNNAH